MVRLKHNVSFHYTSNLCEVSVYTQRVVELLYLSFDVDASQFTDKLMF
jgi:hypothetical protein